MTKAQLTPEAQELLLHTMEQLDSYYDDAAGLLLFHDEHPRYDGKAHNVRESSHYALGLLLRNRKGDTERACHVIRAVLAQQLDAPGEIYHGTFKRAPQEPDPPRDVLPWREIPLHSRWLAERSFFHAENAFVRRLEALDLSPKQVRQIRAELAGAAADVLPVVWKTYDPNWREFIGCSFALILEFFETKLPGELTEEVDRAMKRMLEGSIARVQSGFTPLNTNIELMHIFITDYFGVRYGDRSIRTHSRGWREKFLRNYREHHSVAEYNSPTYCSVDLSAAAMLRQCAASEEASAFGTYMEEHLWRDIARYYNPALDNLCPPFARNYEMDLKLHTSMHVFFYLGLGKELAKFPPDNVETSHNALITLCGTRIPEDIKPALLSHQGDRSVTARFHELSERGDPRDNTRLCTASSYIARNWMIGALSGSRNVSGQLHTAGAYWKQGDQVLSLRLRRRRPGEEPGDLHLTWFDNTVTDNRMEIHAVSDARCAVEVFFEIDGALPADCSISQGRWLLPGMEIRVTGAELPQIREAKGKTELVFPLPAWERVQRLEFALEFHTTHL